MKPLVASLRYRFEASVQVVFDHLVLHRDFAAWVDRTELDPQDVRLLFENGAYAGVSGPPLIPGLERMVLLVDVCKAPNFVRYRPLQVTAAMVGAERLACFPYRSMTQQLRLTEEGGNCIVEHQMSFEPRGIRGWLLCKFFVLPNGKRGELASYGRLSRYLKSRTPL